MSSNVGYGIPVNYDYLNVFNSVFSPSTIHVKNTQLQKFFARYLFQKAISVFKWQLPDTWNRDYFLYVLYAWGFIGVVETDKFGIICQAGAPYGYDIYYQPTNLIITNPLLKGSLNPRIGTDCTVIKLQTDWGGVMDLVNCYADMLALCLETAGINLLNSHLPFVFPAYNEAEAQTFKKLYDKAASGEPAIAVGKNMFAEDGKPLWDVFVQNVGQNYITDRVLSDMRKIEAEFDTKIGIPNSNTDKRERLITDEVNANNVETATLCELWLESVKDGCKKTSEMFGIDLSVNWRNPPQKEGVPDESNSVNSRPV